MGILNDLKRVLFGAKSVTKHGAEKAKEKVSETVSEKKEELVDETEKILEDLKEEFDATKIKTKEKIDSAMLDEIMSSGKKAMKKLSMAALSLQEAKNWGNWDMMQKRQRMGEYYKHSAIDDAKRYAIDAKRALIAFERELYEIDLHLNIKQLDISSMSSFLDIFFDNLITDWIFQQKIKKTLSSVNLVIDDVKSVIKKLDLRQSDLQQELEDLIVQKEKVLVL